MKEKVTDRASIRSTEVSRRKREIWEEKVFKQKKRRYYCAFESKD